MGRSSWIVEFALVAAAASLCAAPSTMVTRLRAAAVDLFHPGATLVQDGYRTVANWIEARESSRVQELAARTADLEDRFNESERQRRALESLVATAAERMSLRYLLAPSERSRNNERLIDTQLVRAAVLGKPLAAGWKSGRFLKSGSQDGLRESLAVVRAELPLIDLGADHGLEVEQLAVLGRTIVGELAEVGRWSSALRLADDPDYRARGQLARQTAQGLQLAAVGMVHGVGDGCCELRGVDATEFVEVGDQLFTADRDGVLPFPLYYGEVTEAHLGSDDRHWKIRVKLAPRPACLTQVDVLVPRANPERDLARVFTQEATR
ncbi:MAG: rod shape-determining protein MreC [Planctomycetaceae bacterium]|nr:rod shape-determining protein MreC [Planctomycetaceae bacterium]